MQQSSFTPNSAALALHRRAIIIDAVCNYLEPATDWIDGGATAAVPTIAIREDSRQTFELIASWYRRLAQNTDYLMHVTGVREFERAKSEGKLGIVFAFQDTTPLDWNLDLVEAYYRLGVRMMGLAYNQRNRVADGCGEHADAGLSSFGAAVVCEMNRVGIVVDCSHTGYRSSMEAIELSSRPPVFSHSNPRALCDNGRNIWDDQIKAVAAKGGLVGLGAFPTFVSENSKPTLKDWLDQMDYVVDLVGPDHVGIGLDHFQWSSITEDAYNELLRTGMWYEPDYPPPPHPFPAGMESAAQLPNITAGLLERGYSEEDVLKILGENWVRVFAANWQ